MRFIRLIQYDIKNGFIQNIWKFIPLIALTILSCIEYETRRQSFLGGQIQIGTETIAEYWCYLLGGCRIFTPANDEVFIVPIKWLLFHLLLLYGTLNYAYKDLTAYATLILPRTESRMKWWLSKCIFCFCYVMSAYLVVFFVTGVIGVIFGAQISASVSTQFLENFMDITSSYETISRQFVWNIVGLPTLFAIGSAIVQQIFALWLKPVFAFCIMAVWLIAASYKPVWILWENFAMPVRSSFVISTGYSTGTAVSVGICLCFAGIFVGNIYFRKYHILEMEQ